MQLNPRRRRLEAATPADPPEGNKGIPPKPAPPRRALDTTRMYDTHPRNTAQK
jgi:hypothetical protein